MTPAATTSAAAKARVEERGKQLGDELLQILARFGEARVIPAIDEINAAGGDATPLVEALAAYLHIYADGLVGNGDDRAPRNARIAELELENARLREELRYQWARNHFENCSREWPHPKGKRCYWPPPGALGSSE